MTMTSGESPSTQILEVNGGGLALLDFDNDGDFDLFVSNGATLKDPEHGPGCRLFENITNPKDGVVRFRDITKQAGVNITRWAFGANVGDFDGDGFDDIHVSCYGPNILLRNTGTGTFEDVTTRAGASGSDQAWSSSAAWGDIDNDGDLDLYVTNYLVFDPANPPPTGKYKGADVLNGPHGLTPQADVLYENLGDGTFRNITDGSGCGTARPSFGLNVVILDVDRDGWQDIIVANDSMPGFLFHNKGQGLGTRDQGAGTASGGADGAANPQPLNPNPSRFEEIGVISGLSANADGGNQAAMGLAFGDVDGNGLPDKFTTVFSSDTNALHMNYNGTTFEDRAQQYGLGMISRPYLGWATAFYDFDHDGDEDLLMFNGHVYPNASMELMDSEYEQTPLLFARAPGGKRFKRVTEQDGGEWLGEKHRSRCAAWGDLDNDGDIDVIVGELNGPIRVLRNDAIDVAKVNDASNWLIVSLRDDRPASRNRRGIGSVIELNAGDTKQTRWLYSGGSFQSSNAPYVHFAVPPAIAASADSKPSLTVTWPDGTKQQINDVALGQHLIVRRTN